MGRRLEEGEVRATAEFLATRGWVKRAALVDDLCDAWLARGRVVEAARLGKQEWEEKVAHVAPGKDPWTPEFASPASLVLIAALAELDGA